MPAKNQAWFGLAVLTAMNLLNYLDRYVVSAVLPLIKAELGVSDAALGTLATAFIISYVVFSPIAGYIGDRATRKYLVSASVLIWSLATIATGLARNYHELMIARAITGIGEAGYATVAPSIISDLFDKSRRGSALAIFYTALPVGSALGLVLGGYWGVHHGWRHAFYFAGGPGILSSILMAFTYEPQRGASDGIVGRKAAGSPLTPYFELLKIRTYLYANFGMAAYTFAIGGLVFWVPTFLNRIRGMELQHATFWIGILSVIGGTAGGLAGGVICDRLRPRFRSSYMLIPGISLLLAFPPLILFFEFKDPILLWTLFLIANFFLFINTGPLNAAIINVVLPERRATAVALNILIIHILGDALSPVLIGEMSDRFGLMAAAQGISFTTLVAAFIILFGAKYLQEDEQAISLRDAK
jgi:MFS transporter, Spinster family, sphingosine-1-phosphate transporter